MDSVINDFVYLLRRNGVRVSPAESLDALHALQAVGLGERGAVRDALRATLVKNTDEITAFDRLFDLYFGLHRPVEPLPRGVRLDHDHDHGGDIRRVTLGEDLDKEGRSADHDHSHEAPDSTDIRRFFDEDQLRPSTDLHGAPESIRLALFAQELVLNHRQGALQQIIQRITHRLRVRRARNIFNPGGLTPFGESEEMPIDISAAELQVLVDHLHDMEVDDMLIQQLLAQTDSILRGLPALVKTMLERQRRLSAGGCDDKEILQRSLRRLLDFSAAEQRALEAAIRRLARQIHGAHTQRQRRARIGRISAAHTLRHNLRYEAIPFDPVLRRRRMRRPRLVLLCDVSLSTRNLARFWLHLVYQMQRLFSKVRTFVYVADLVEVTHLFEEQTLHQAVEAIFGGRLLDVDVKSDFGCAVGQFRNDFLAGVTRRTTIVILGDGRNNGRPPNEAALAEVTRRAHRVIWLTPEPKWAWSLGDCAMPMYARLVQRVEVVRTVEQLASVAEDLAGYHPAAAG